MLYEACKAGVGAAQQVLECLSARSESGDTRAVEMAVYETVDVGDHAALHGMFALHALCVWSPGPHQLAVVNLLLTAPLTRRMALSVCGEDDWNAAQLAVLHGSLELMQLVVRQVKPPHLWPVFADQCLHPPLLNLLHTRCDATAEMQQWMRLEPACTAVPAAVPAVYVYASAGSLAKVRHLLAGSPPGARRGDAATALAGAVECGQATVVAWLLEQAYCPAMHEPLEVPRPLRSAPGAVDGISLLAAAIKLGHTRLLHMLVSHPGAGTALRCLDLDLERSPMRHQGPRGGTARVSESDSNIAVADRRRLMAVRLAVRAIRRERMWSQRGCLVMLRALRASNRARCVAKPGQQAAEQSGVLRAVVTIRVGCNGRPRRMRWMAEADK